VQKGTTANDDVNAVGATRISWNIQCRYRFKVIDKDPNQNALGT
jgi:hypothetical protein